MNTISKWLMAIALLSGPVVANGGLTSVAGGLGVYDSTNDVTWTANGNLFASQYSTTVVNTIIADANAANGGVGLSGLAGYTLSANDFREGGEMTWQGAVAWVNYLNVIKYGGSSKWALPTTVDSSASFGFPNGQSGTFEGDPLVPVDSSQLAQLFYGQLGQVAGSSITTTNNGNGGYNLFSNIQDTEYWSGTQYSASTGYAWVFQTNLGVQYGYGDESTTFFALAVAPGEITPPAALLTALQAQVNGIAPEGLEDKATSALKHLQASCTSLANFVNQVQAQNGKKIGQTLAAQLIGEAQTIKTAIGCN